MNILSPKIKRQYKPWIYQSSYSGCDIIPIVYGIDATTHQPKLFVVGDIATLTYSIHRDKGAVRTLGRAMPKGFVRGSRTIAGTIIFSIFDRRALWELSKRGTDRVMLADEIPGFDVVLYFTNEFGNESTMAIRNIQILDEGQSHSVQDVYIENTMSYMAQDIDLLEPKEFAVSSNGLFSADRRAQLNKRVDMPFDYKYLEVAKEKVTVETIKRSGIFGL